ncbi:SusC/RagA family TonB-linked outer membrane protein [Mucilaginibacter celer]|uniref:SusC/RagA family TonB-linked outer membrane protein n=1 Tax=Mucilaginibacter celer TaxID=2305508 RepID=A0A494VM06_9SPHI|nr:TonB-dependent receptor [Mucilaginibacter celer]AYL95634.1 SusC/RagA family TonB-linked outer membrane protein [Mucilaginibacter celer]
MKIKLLLIIMLLCGAASAQQRSLSGTVTSKDLGTPLAGVTVKSPRQTVTTDNNGRFTVNVAPNETVTFTFVGMQAVNYTYHGETSPVAILLEYSSGNLNEVVVTGYQTQKKADLTGSVAVVNMTDIKNVRQGNPIKSLQGRIPGVNITSNGDPGGGATVRIRGINTLGNNDPLYVIDGIPTKRGLQEINQDDIESIQVLKDASSATIYGSRAANGVIIVTTKRAKNGVHRIDVNASSSIEYYTTKQSMLNTNQRGEAYWRAALNDKFNPNNNQIYQYDWNNDFNNPVLNRVILPEFIDAAKTMRSADTKWYDEISQASLLQNYNLAFTNGSERGNSYFSLGYYDNKGVVRESRAKKITMRLNSEYNFLNGKLKIGENFNATYANNVLIPTGDVLFTALVQQPIVPVHTVSGGWGGPASGMTDRHNPVRLIEDNKQNKNYFGRIIANAYADLTILPGLHAKTNYGVDYAGTWLRTLRKSYVSGFLTDPSNLVQNSQNYDGNLIFQNTINYNTDFGKHHIDAVLGHESIRFINQNFFASRQGYALENLDYAYLDRGTTNINNGGNGTANSLLSFFGKVNYVYANKYLLSGTLRRDGSSRFGANNRYGYFPAGSAGWRISQEPFLKDSKIVSDLKLRYSYGEAGNQETGNYATYSLYSAIYGLSNNDVIGGTAYDIIGAGTGTLPSGFVKIQQENPDLKWETTKESNFGVDFGLFNQSITGSVDYFIKNTSGILITPGYLAVIGEGGTKTFNGASMQNKGIDAIVNYDGRITSDLTFGISANFSKYINKVTYLPSEIYTAYAGNGTDQIIVGKSINSIFGYVADGLFTSADQVTNSPAQPGKGLGRIRFKDLNGDNVINDRDRTYISNGNPDFLYGLNLSLRWKNFDLAAFFQGVQGLKVYNSYKTYTDFSSIWPGGNWGTRTLDAWSPQRPNSTIPALTLVNTNDENRTSTYFIENGSYLKLRNLQVGYSLKDALKSIKVQNARVFFQGANLWTIKSKGYTAADPENPGNGYPVPAIVTFGLDLSF